MRARLSATVVQHFNSTRSLSLSNCIPEARGGLLQERTAQIDSAAGIRLFQRRQAFGEDWTPDASRVGMTAVQKVVAHTTGER